MNPQSNGAATPINRDYYVYYNDFVGEGAYGTVYKGYSKKDNKIVAVKKLKNDATEQWKKNPAIKREVEVMSRVNHENVLRLYEAVENQNGVFMIMEFCSGGDLKKISAEAKARQKKTGVQDPNRSGLSELEVFRYFYEIVQGMAEINEKGFLHRDLKLQNIMLNEQGKIKIADFGLARQIIGTDIYKLEKYSAKGTPIYAAPQIIRGEKFSGLCDVWSCGLVIYELLTGRNYFEKATNLYSLQGLQDKLLNEALKVPPHFNKFFREILPMMVTYSEDTRVCFIELAKVLARDRNEILKSIDPTAVVPQNIAVKPNQIKQQVYNSDKPGGDVPIMPTQDMAAMKKRQEQNYLLLVEVSSYMDFVYGRGKLMIDLMGKLNTTPNYPINSGCKYTLIFLQMGIFFSTVSFMVKYLKQPVLQLPSGRSIVKDEFDPKTKQNLTRYVEQYCKKIEQEKAKFNITLVQISSKLLSEDYKKRFPDLYQRYPQIYVKLAQLVNGAEESREWYESQYQLVLRQECRLPQKESQTDDVLRVYWMCLVMSRVREYLPDAQYVDKNMLAKVRQNFDKAPRAAMLQNIGNQ